ncbi:MAG: shikimate dehydrogenase [Anaerolineales bacterium]|nr:shikimate dehydrogenase [Chloroflexota bacterium]MBL6982889.1 shikimate dehydrogenase [Anaerolineales bacterium]
MDTFAFIIHPIDPKRDVSRKFPFLGKVLSTKQINFFSTFFPPIYLSEIQGIASLTTGKQISGWLIACPLTAARMLELPEKIVYHKVIQTGRLAERLGAKILGLGAFTSVIGDGGISIASSLDIPVTTGDAYTISVAVQAVLDAANILGINAKQATAAVVGASGAIGQVCSELLASEVAELYLIGKSIEKLEHLKKRIANQTKVDLAVSTDLSDVKKAQLVLTVSSAAHSIIQPEHLRPGSVVCDVARPRDISAIVAETRKDVLVIDGGVVDIPGEVKFNFDFGFPPGKAYACMAETIALTLEGRFEDYTVGKEIARQRVVEITQMASKHGFKLSGFRSFEKPVTNAQITEVRKYAYHV